MGARIHTDVLDVTPGRRATDGPKRPGVPSAADKAHSFAPIILMNDAGWIMRVERVVVHDDRSASQLVRSGCSSSPALTAVATSMSSCNQEEK
jgi:hypothetical protein